MQYQVVKDGVSIGNFIYTEPVVYSKPKLALVDYRGGVTSITSPARMDEVSRFGFIILGLYPSIGLANITTFVQGIKQRNPNALVFNYTDLSDVSKTLTTTDDQYPLMQWVNANNAWLYRADGKTLVQSFAQAGRYDINFLTPGWQAFKVAYDQKVLPPNTFNGILVDNCVNLTRQPADFYKVGVDYPAKNPTASQAYRASRKMFIQLHQNTQPQLQVVGNIENDSLTSPEYRGIIDHGFLEAVIGETWSNETWAGWDKMMGWYKDAINGVTVKDSVVFNVHGLPTDFALNRYGLASCMLDNGYYSFSANSSYSSTPAWFDEFDAPIGKPIAAAIKQTNGVWSRQYENGLVLVNPDKINAQTFDATGYKFITGVQDPTVNTGLAASVVTLPARSGLLLLKA
jgi:hypothetical protein